MTREYNSPRFVRASCWKPVYPGSPAEQVHIRHLLYDGRVELLNLTIRVEFPKWQGSHISLAAVVCTILCSLRAPVLKRSLVAINSQNVIEIMSLLFEWQHNVQAKKNIKKKKIISPVGWKLSLKQRKEKTKQKINQTNKTKKEPQRGSYGPAVIVTRNGSDQSWIASQSSSNRAPGVYSIVPVWFLYDCSLVSKSAVLEKKKIKKGGVGSGHAEIHIMSDLCVYCNATPLSKAENSIPFQTLSSKAVNFAHSFWFVRPRAAHCLTTLLFGSMFNYFHNAGLSGG